MKPKSALAAVACLLLLAVATPAWAASGDLDSSFDGDGVFTFGLANPAEEGTSGVAVDPSGRLIVGTYVYPSNMAVTRVLPGGGVDTTFGGGTAQLTDGKTRLTNAVGVQPDGRVLSAGNAGTNGQNVFLARYRTNGNADGSFATGGLAHVQVCGTTAYETNVFVRSDGSIVVVGDCGNGSSNDRMFVLGFRPGGGLNGSFSGDGVFELKIGDDFWVRDAVLDGNDRLTVVGTSTVGGGDDRATVLRLTARGKLDTRFSRDGKAIFDLTDVSDDARAVARRGNGVLVAERTTDGATGDFLLFAVTGTGKLDKSFSGNGTARIDLFGNDLPTDLVTDRSDHIYLSATTPYNALTQATVLRLRPKGALDTTFSSDGVAGVGIKSFAGTMTMWKGKPTVTGGADFTTDFDDLVARFLS